MSPSYFAQIIYFCVPLYHAKARVPHSAPTPARPDPASRKILRRGGRAVDCGGLENRCAGNRTEGSNPSLSAVSFSNFPSKAC